MQVNGTLMAEGKLSAPIRFTVVDTIGFWKIDSDSGSWEGIYFNNGYDGLNNAMTDNDTSVFRFCDFSFAKNPGPDVNGAAITIRYYGGVEISECHFHDNVSRYGAGGVYSDKSTLKVSNSKFEKNISDEGAAFTAYSSEVILSGNEFTENYGMNMGGAVRFVGTEAIVENNSFTYNRSENGGAIATHSSPMTIRNNLFANNEAYYSGGALNINYTAFQ